MNKIKKYSILIIIAMFWAFHSSAVDFFTIGEAMEYVGLHASASVVSRVQPIVTLGFEAEKGSFSDAELDQLIMEMEQAEWHKKMSPEEELLRSREYSQSPDHFIDHLKHANAKSLESPEFRMVTEKLPQGCFWSRSLRQGNESICPFFTVYNAFKIQAHFRERGTIGPVDYNTYNEKDFISFLRAIGGLGDKANEPKFMGDQPPEDALPNLAKHFGIRNFYTLSGQVGKYGTEYVLNCPDSMFVKGSDYVRFMLRKFALIPEPIFIASFLSDRGEKPPRHWLLYAIVPAGGNRRDIILMDSANEGSICPTRMPVILNQLEFLRMTIEEKEKLMTCLDATGYVDNAAEDEKISGQKHLKAMNYLMGRKENITLSDLFNIMGIKEENLVRKGPHEPKVISPAAASSAGESGQALENKPPLIGSEANCLPFATCKTPYKWAPSFKPKISAEPPSISMRGEVPGGVLFRLPVAHFNKGDRISMRGNIQEGKIEFGLAFADEHGWVCANTLGVGEFDSTVTIPYEGDFLPLFMCDKNLGIDATITDISLP